MILFKKLDFIIWKIDFHIIRYFYKVLVLQAYMLQVTRKFSLLDSEEL